MISNVVIIGCVGTAKNIIEQILDAELNYKVNIHLAGICIDSLKTGEKVEGIPVIAGTGDIKSLVYETDYQFLFALFKPEKMRERYLLLRSYNIPPGRWTNFVHPRAWMAKSVRSGYGNIILSNTSLMSNVKLANFNIINPGVTIEHGTSIGEGNFFAAGCTIGADVKIGDCNFIGLNTTVRESVKLGSSVYAGMGSLILNDFEKVMVYGQPAKIRKEWK